MTDTFTPLMKQYHAIKSQYPDAILLFRVGDFYEMFGDDAVTGAKLLKLTLTKKHVGKDQTVPLAGVPHHAVQSYLARLIRQGCKVAICEQMEDPKFAKGVVKRDVIRVITPGTILESSLLDEKVNNFLIAINLKSETANKKTDTVQIGFAVIDLTTGEFNLTELQDSNHFEKLQNEIQRLQPRECLIPNDVGYNGHSLQSLIQPTPGLTFYPYNGYQFDTDSGYRELTRQFGTTSLKGFGCEEMRWAIGAAGAILNYLKETQKTNLEHIRSIRTYSIDEYLILDASTLQNLEIFRTTRDDNKEGSLLGIIDQTVTAMGGRKLRSWLSQPLLNLDKLNIRQEAVQFFFENHRLRTNIRETLDNIYDLERLLGRIGCGLGNARDMIALSKSLDLIPQLKNILQQNLLGSKNQDEILSSSPLRKSPSLIVELTHKLNDSPEIRDLISRAIVDDPPLSVKEGGLIKEGYHSELDELRAITRGGKQWIVELETKERERTTIKSLKVRFNNVFGYYIEVTKPNLHLVPEDYQRKQTTSNSERFITPELKEWESKILGAEEHMMELEYSLFCELREKIALHTQEIQETGDAVGQLDSLSALAEVAVQYDYCRPVLKTDMRIDIREGRHPVVERVLNAGQFVPNDILLDIEENTVLLITGPNMAGKSTFIRQVALIVLMAQIGCFVPAKSAEIGLVDRIFTRVGAADNLLRGESTFMVEMNETANILHNATQKSLLVLDEIGRGTSTFDGLSIAWAVAEHIHDKIGARTLFATHYHELTQLSGMLSGIKNFNVAVKEWNDQVIFLHKIITGACDKSYGIAVGRLAGLPDGVITRAKEVLVDLEKYSESAQSELAKTHANVGNIRPAVNTVQLTFFESVPNPTLEEIKKLDLTNLTPIQALTKLQEIQDKLKKN